MSSDRTSATLESVEAVVRENVTGYVDGDLHEHGKQRLLTALRQGRKTATVSWPRRAAVGVALATALAAGAYGWKQHRNARLGYEVSGGLLSDSGYVRSNGPGGAQLTFTDGSRLDLQDGSRARIATVDAHGARIAIENGHATLGVTRLPGAAWSVDAGPFVIQVNGARFDVDWSSYDDTLSVDLHEGNLVVSGPPAPNGVLLRSGQRLTALEGRLSIEALEMSAQAPEPAVAVEPLPAVPDSLLAEPVGDAPLPEPSTVQSAFPPAPSAER